MNMAVSTRSFFSFDAFGIRSLVPQHASASETKHNGAYMYIHHLNRIGGNRIAIINNICFILFFVVEGFTIEIPLKVTPFY